MIPNNKYNVRTQESIIINSHSEILVCKYCGNSYYSIGKKDPGYCKECGMFFFDGPLDGTKVGEIRDNSGGETESN